MENVQQNDWFATILYNPDKDFKNFKEAGLDAANTGLKDRESYKIYRQCKTNSKMLKVILMKNYIISSMIAL